jgi:DNA-binding MarR family transcriptional regulator/GNAT superfamily N-acetyltransferase
MEQMIASVRGFNRFFTRLVGALDADFLDTGMTLAEARLLFEIAQRDGCFADDLQRELKLDAGFVSRVLRRFEGRRWIRRSPLPGDRRRRSISLTASGRRRFDKLDSRQRGVVEQTLQQLDGPARHRLVGALGTAQQLLEAGKASPFELRPFRAGDMGLITSRQSILYRERFGWSAGIEINIGEVTTAFLRNFKSGREQCWVAQIDGQMAGSVFLTDEGDGLCRLRLLYVEPVCQGHGIGDALVSACVGFGRAAGYARMTLWTHSILEGARRIYARHGFSIVSVAEHSQFGPTLTGETWELSL